MEWKGIIRIMVQNAPILKSSPILQILVHTRSPLASGFRRNDVGHPPSPLALSEGGRFLAALGMTWGTRRNDMGREGIIRIIQKSFASWFKMPHHHSPSFQSLTSQFKIPSMS